MPESGEKVGGRGRARAWQGGMRHPYLRMQTEVQEEHSDYILYLKADVFSRLCQWEPQAHKAQTSGPAGEEQRGAKRSITLSLASFKVHDSLSKTTTSDHPGVHEAR